MSVLCNFGERELPDKVPFPKAPELGSVENFSDFNLFYRNYEMDVRTDAMYNPVMQRKVDILCEEYSAEQLDLAIKDLEWKELSAKRNYFDAICTYNKGGGRAADLSEVKDKLDVILANLTVMRLALERQKIDDDDSTEEVKA